MEFIYQNSCSKHLKNTKSLHTIQAKPSQQTSGNFIVSKAESLKPVYGCFLLKIFKLHKLQLLYLI